MAFSGSPLPLPPDTRSADYDQMNIDLDDEIMDIRAQIQELTKRRRLVSSTLLSSSSIQAQLQKSANDRSILQDDNTLLSNSQKHAQSNLHRLAFSVTAFPFSDPSPKTSVGHLLGVRIDICGRTGKFDKPYYIFLKRARIEGDTSRSAEDALRVHRHTIPTFIPLRRYEDQYLPLQGEAEASEVSDNRTYPLRQDLHMFVRKVRQELLSWTLRRAAIDLLQEELNLAVVQSHESEIADGKGRPDKGPEEVVGRYGIKSIAKTAVEARYARLEWEDGRVGRVKISDNGTIERAVVFGDEGRHKSAEHVLAGQDVLVESLTEKLKILASRKT